MNDNRIQKQFTRTKTQQKTALILYLTAGFPDIGATEELIPALVEAGADGIEIGVPFSDPLADGATIQASSFTALQQGITLKDCLDLVGRVRHKVPNTPIILMGYYNPIFNVGLESFCAMAKKATVDGLIIPDLPVEESNPLLEQCNSFGIDLIPLLAPTSTDERIGKICAVASGFIYCVSVTGVTGARTEIGPEVPQLVKRIRSWTNLPIGVGFGISTPQHMNDIGRVADAGIVGSALIRIIQDSPRRDLIARASTFVDNIRKTTPRTVEGAY